MPVGGDDVSAKRREGKWKSVACGDRAIHIPSSYNAFSAFTRFSVATFASPNSIIVLS